MAVAPDAFSPKASSTIKSPTMATTSRENISRYETTAVYTHPEAEVDIVLVHGLNGHPGGTWTAADGTFWPTDLLPEALRGVPANVLVYGYNADVYSCQNDRSASDNFIHQHAQTLVTSLTLFRRGEGRARNPLVWVAHSLGGILVKRALLYAADLRAAHQDDYRAVFVSTYGIFFLGTPHTGSGAATWGRALQAMSDAVLPRKLFDSEPVLLRTLRKDNETLVNINSHFLDIYQRFRIHMVHENHKTDLKGTKMLIVDPNSASPQLPGVTYYGVEATHSQMCKFASTHAPGFNALSTDLRQWILDAPALIRQRWAAEECERAARLQNELSERMATASSPPVSLYAYSHHHGDCAASTPSMSAPPSPLPPYAAIGTPPPAYEEKFISMLPPPQYYASRPTTPTMPAACHCCCHGHGHGPQEDNVTAVVRGITAAASLACSVAEAVVAGVTDLAAATLSSSSRCCLHAGTSSQRQGDSILPQFV